MYKEENLQDVVLDINKVAESLEIKRVTEFVNALLNYSNYEDFTVLDNDITYSRNTKETWIAIADALSGLLGLDYTPKGNLQEYADEIYELAEFRVKNNISPENNFTLDEIKAEVNEKIAILSVLLMKLNLLEKTSKRMSNNLGKAE